MRPIYTAEEIRNWDEYTIQKEPISSIDLMYRAASRATKAILTLHLFDDLAIVCGPGNNGGDGLVIAQLLHECDKNVKLFILKSEKYSADFTHYLSKLDKKISKVYIEQPSDFNLGSEQLMIDCLFGTGLNKAVTGLASELIKSMNNAQIPIVSIDIPSGLSPDSRNTEKNSIVHANNTLTFAQLKRSFLFSSNASYTGKIKIIDIDLHEDYSADCNWSILTEQDILIHKKPPFNHKGNNGKALIIGGFNGLNGAAILASRAALMTGSGYVYCASEMPTREALLIAQPEIINLATAQIDSISPTAVGIGVGLGMDETAIDGLKEAFKLNCPMVIDADAINLLAKHPELQEQLPANTILTPHFKELQRLIGDFEEQEMIQHQRDFSQNHQVYILQKGRYSKITTPSGEIIVNPSGNSAMATAGMGDVLTGLITSLLAQGYTPSQAVCYGCYLHGKAADELVYKESLYILTASQVIEQLPRTITNFVV